MLHGLQHGDDLVVGVAILDHEHVPAVRGPLIDQLVAFVLAIDDTTDQRVVDARVVVRDHHAEPLADFERERLRLELLRVTLGHRELTFEGDDLRRVDTRAHHVPEGRLAGCGRNADSRGPTVDVVGDVGALGVSGQRANAAHLRLREERMIGKPVILEQRRHRTGAASEPERVDRQDRDVRIGVVAPVAGRFELPRQRLAHDHPQRIARRDAVATREHELVAVGMLRPPVVEAQSTEIGTGQVRRHVVGRVGQWAAKVPGLRIVAQEHEGHARHEPHVFETLPVVRRGQGFNSGQRSCSSQNDSSVALGSGLWALAL